MATVVTSVGATRPPPSPAVGPPDRRCHECWSHQTTTVTGGGATGSSLSRVLERPDHHRHRRWGDRIVAALWVAYQPNLGTLLRTCDAVGACMAMPGTTHYRRALAGWCQTHAARLDEHSSPLAAFSKPPFQTEE
jgi:hypothetical protein